jgi:hypothetical protein
LQSRNQTKFKQKMNMKNLILAFTVILFSINVYAQSDSIKVLKTHKRVVTSKRVTSKTYTTHKAKHPDGVMLVDGKVMTIKEGKMAKLEGEIYLNNGTKVTPEGMCVDKTGTTMMMKEGEHLDMEGNMVKMKKK